VVGIRWPTRLFVVGDGHGGSGWVGGGAGGGRSDWRGQAGRSGGRHDWLGQAGRSGCAHDGHDAKW